MNKDFIFLTEKEEMWAKMLMEVLQDNDIPCTAFPLYGAAITVKSGKPEVMSIFVPSDKYEAALELMNQLFGEDNI